MKQLQRVMREEFGFSMQARRRRMVQISNGLLFAVAMAFVIFRLFTLGLQHPPWPAFGVALLVAANGIYLHRGGSADVATWFLFAFLVLGLILSGVNTGGFNGPTVLLSPILPVLAALLMGARLAWVASAVVLSVLIVLFSLQYAGIIVPSPQSANALLLARFIALICTMLVCTTVAWFFSNNLGDLVDKVKSQADTDYLTGLANRRAIEATLLREVGRARRNGSNLSLIMTDVDHFKRYNDCNGHQAGDRCLVTVADTLTHCARRPADLVGRFGGEEFIILLPETDQDGARQVAECMRSSMLEKKLHYTSQLDQRVSLTFGCVTVAGKQITGIEQLLREADAALYQGKRQGRNRVVSARIDNLQPGSGELHALGAA